MKLHGPGWDDIPLQAGQALNVVPDKATYAGHRLEELLPVLDQSGVQYSQTEDSVTVLGVSKHSKDAAEGVNAIVGLAESLSNPIQLCYLSQMQLVRMQLVRLYLALFQMNQVAIFPLILRPL